MNEEDRDTSDSRISGAIGEIRTPGLLITNQVLYQLSYNGSDAPT